jgi:hypothetical protein
MPDSDQEEPARKADVVDRFDEIAAGFGILPEIIGAGDLECLNSALAEMFEVLRQAALLRPTYQRAAAVRALNAVSFFIMRFHTGVGQNLHAPLMDLASALLALNENKVEPLLKPTPASAGGRAPDSPARQALIGFAVGAVGRLQWAGLQRAVAHKAVADTLHKIGIRPSRGSGRLTARTVREWCERTAADIGGRSIAAMNANLMLTDEWQAKITALPPSDARKFLLDALTVNVRELNLDDAAPQKPANPPS